MTHDKIHVILSTFSYHSPIIFHYIILLIIVL